MNELTVIRRYLKACRALGYTLSCEDTGRIKALGPITDAIYSTGYAKVKVWDGTRLVGTLLFITNNGDPECVLADWGAIPALDKALDAVLEGLN